MVSVSFVITCKGRLRHIKKNLPPLLEQPVDEVVVVDYGCPDKVGDWIEKNYSEVNVVRITDDPGFCVSRARNKGAVTVKSEWLCFLDADVLVKPGFVAWMKKTLNDPAYFYRASLVDGKRITETWGTCIVSRQAYERLDGYDEAFRGWGGEDDDLYERLIEEGYIESEYPHMYVEALLHDDSERVVFYDIKDIKNHMILNAVYRYIKKKIQDQHQAKLPLDLRKELIAQLTTQLYDQNAHSLNMDKTISIRFESSRSDTLTTVYKFKRKRRYGFFGPRKLSLIS